MRTAQIPVNGVILGDPTSTVTLSHQLFQYPTILSTSIVDDVRSLSRRNLKVRSGCLFMKALSQKVACRMNLAELGGWVADGCDES